MLCAHVVAQMRIVKTDMADLVRPYVACCVVRGVDLQSAGPTGGKFSGTKFKQFLAIQVRLVIV